MTTCNRCGAWIDWIRTKKGRPMPVEPTPVVIVPDRGTETFITDEGEILKGVRTPAGPVGGNLVAYVPHWARCSDRRARQGTK